jgi:Trypsin-co-occurring domain 1
MTKTAAKRNREPSAILVEFSSSGLKPVAKLPWNKETLLQKSSEAVNGALSIVQEVSDRLQTTMETMSDASNKRKPDRIDIQFNIKLDGELGAIIAKVGAEASFNVNLSWDVKK